MNKETPKEEAQRIKNETDYENPQQGWEKEFDDILGKEMSGILIMNSKRRFDMCERLLTKNGKLKSFIRQLLQQIREETLRLVIEDVPHAYQKRLIEKLK